MEVVLVAAWIDEDKENLCWKLFWTAYLQLSGLRGAEDEQPGLCVQVAAVAHTACVPEFLIYLSKKTGGSPKTVHMLSINRWCVSI